MCGIAGSIGVAPGAAEVRATLAAMRRRGPDASGVHHDQLGPHAVSLLHTRLSILDLDSRSDQPFVDGDLVLVFNGELYNYIELRADLEALGHRFRTRSDTEVVLRACRQYGEAAFDRFEGMWALALLDRKAGTLTLSRDRFGEKPLFYAVWGQTLYFASEVKSLAALAGRAPEVNTRQVQRYLVNGYRALHKGRETFFADVGAMPAASLATLTGPDEPAPQPYWRLAYRPVAMTAAEAVAGARAQLERALKIRLRADVPVAFCLSGGVDSTALATLAARKLGAQLHAFTVVDADERYNESESVAATVRHLGCAHHVAHTSTEGFFARLDDLVAYHDSPVATISYYVHSFLSEEISRLGYKVAISGTGADELYTGYYDHYCFWLAERADDDKYPQLLEQWRQGYGATVRNPLLQDPLAFHRDPGRRDHLYGDRERFNAMQVAPLNEDFAEEAYCDNLLRNRMLNELFHEVVPVILHEDDLNSMRWSVENRSPYLDRGLAEFLFTVPGEHLIRDGFAKWILRASADDVAPRDVIWDKRKRGFNASIDSLVDRDDPDTRDRLLAPGPIFDLVRRDAFEKFVDGDMTDNTRSKYLFSFLSARSFLESDLVAGGDAARRAA